MLDENVQAAQFSILGRSKIDNSMEPISDEISGDTSRKILTKREELSRKKRFGIQDLSLGDLEMAFQEV